MGEKGKDIADREITTRGGTEIYRELGCYHLSRGVIIHLVL